jgi:chromosome segregation ATPase
MKRRQCLLFVVAVLVLICFVGCATEESVQNLEKRLNALEQKQKATETAATERQQKLENCVKKDADEAYWSYIRLNGTAVPNEPGTYRAPQYQWQEAARRKRDKIEECKLLYGPR